MSLKLVALGRTWCQISPIFDFAGNREGKVSLGKVYYSESWCLQQEWSSLRLSPERQQRRHRTSHNKTKICAWWAEVEVNNSLCCENNINHIGK